MLVTGVVAYLTVLIVLLDPVTFVTGSEVRGVLGRSITLPCRYSVSENGETAMCWNRGRCSTFRCSDELIKTNGRTVTLTKSPKYHLDGKIEDGDVSLTIDHLREEDRGLYCCRVEITGVFNDRKENFNLQVLEGNKLPSYTNSLSTSPTSAQTPLSTVPEVRDSGLIYPILLAVRVSVLICFIAITVRLCLWKCKYPIK